MQSIVSKGKDIHEAINLGLEILETTKENVNIEIIQSNTKSFLGLLSKGAIVKLTKKECSFIDHGSDINNQSFNWIFDKKEEQPNTKPLKTKRTEQAAPETDPLAGKVWTKDGKLYYKSSPTYFPMVFCNKGIKLYKNNVLVKENSTLLSENDVYDIKVENEEKETIWKVLIDQQRLKVHLYIQPGFKLYRSLPDIDADHHIELYVIEKKVIHNTLHYSDVLQKLEELKVVRGINEEEIRKAVETNEDGTYEIAVGLEPQPGKDGWIEFQADVDVDRHNGDQPSVVDRAVIHEMKNIPKVEKGQVIAVVHPPVPGQLGYTIYNEPIPAKQTLPIVLKIKRGITMMDDKLVATEYGRPQIVQKDQFVEVTIIPKLTQHGNVSISSGNIHFKGDVEILGDVEEKTVVEAAGDIIVHKTVKNALLSSSEAIISYGNIVSAEISAGKNHILITELGHLLGIINQNIEKITVLINQLVQSPAFKTSDFARGGLNPLIRILLEKKLRNFPPLIKKYIDVVKKSEEFLEDETWRMVAVSLSQFFLSLTNEVTSIDSLHQLSQKIKELHELSNAPLEHNSYITIPNALNSKIYCIGNVLVLGQGAVNTTIHAGGMLKVSGAIRGGEVYGRLGVNINEAGAASGTTTVIAVPSDQKIQINKAMEGTIIKIGDVLHTFTETKYQFIAFLDKNERIVFE